MKNIPFEIEQFRTKNLCLKSYINLLDELLFWNEISKIYLDARMLNEAIDLISWVKETYTTNRWED